MSRDFSLFSIFSIIFGPVYLTGVMKSWRDKDTLVRRCRKVTLNMLWGINQFVSKK